MIDLLFQAVVIQSIFWVIYIGYLKRCHTFQFNRYFLLSGIFSILFIPWLDIPIPVYVEYLVPTEINLVHDSKTQILDSNFTIWPILIYFSIVVLLSFSFIWKCIQLLRLRMECLGISPAGYKIFRLPDHCAPFSFWSASYMALHDWESMDRATIIVKHEDCHLRKAHSIDILLAEVVSIFLWFSPTSRLYIRSIKNNHEYEVDQELIDGRLDMHIYMQVLLNQWTMSSPSIVSPFDYSTNKNRIIMMKSPRTLLSKTRMTVIITAVSFLLISMSFSKKEIMVPIAITENADITLIGTEAALVIDTISPASPTIAEVKYSGSKKSKVKTIPPPPIPPPPPPRLPEFKQPTAQQMNQWADESYSFGVWYNGDRIDNHSLKSIDRGSIYWYSVSRLLSNAKDYGRYIYHVDVLSKEKFEEMKSNVDKIANEIRRDISIWEKDYATWEKRYKRVDQ